MNETGSLRADAPVEPTGAPIGASEVQDERVWGVGWGESVKGDKRIRKDKKLKKILSIEFLFPYSEQYCIMYLFV